MRVFLGLGSNVGNRLENLQFAHNQLLVNDVSIINKSNIYETSPMYNTNQENFLNQVIEVETTISAEDLLTILKSVESKCGRKLDNLKNSPRQLDIDILTYGDKIVNLGDLQIPHIKLKERDFVLKPWSEITPNFTIPGEDKTVKELLNDLTWTTILKEYNF